MADAEGPKIIVDSDWKSQAQAEKERLAAKERPAAAAPAASTAPAAPGAPAEAQGEPADLPPASFEELMRMLITQAMMYMGAFPDPETGRAMVALDLAKFNIDLLGVLEAKTKGNLTDAENQTLSRALYELRMHYVEMGKAVQRAIEQGKLGKAPAGTPLNINPGRPPAGT